jgi:hypothetical protein
MAQVHHRLERIMLVCGNPNAGKSRLLRHMLGDPRLGAEVAINRGPIPPRVLSGGRWLVVRLTSPHESDESQAEFHEKIERACRATKQPFENINYACAVQPEKARKMPGIVETCNGLIRQFCPQRIRVVQLCPDQSGRGDSAIGRADIDLLRKLDVEVVSINATRSQHPAEPGNVRILADFFEFY